MLLVEEFWPRGGDLCSFSQRCQSSGVLVHHLQHMLRRKALQSFCEVAAFSAQFQACADVDEVDKGCSVDGSGGRAASADNASNMAGRINVPSMEK